MQDVQAMMGTTKLLKWAGSKSGIIHRIIPYLNFNQEYIEPFCGSAAFFFESKPKCAHLNDTNKDLIRFYRHIKENYESVFDVYSSIAVGELEYYKARDEYNIESCAIRKSGLFIYLNHYCFNGIYRTNKSGNFNTPFGAKIKAKKKLKLADFERAAQILKSATLDDNDFETFLIKLNPNNACIYMDPPYFTDDERVFGEYGATTFKKEDLTRLARIATDLADKNRIVISYRQCSEFCELFGNYIAGTTNVVRNVGGFRGRRKRDTELIAIMDFKQCAR